MITHIDGSHVFMFSLTGQARYRWSVYIVYSITVSLNDSGESSQELQAYQRRRLCWPWYLHLRGSASAIGVWR